MKCKVEKICGGCSLLKLKPSMQADKKKKDVEELVEKAHLKVRVGDVHMAKNDTHYRNKVIVGFAKDKGKVYSGLYAPHSHRVVKTENCIMQPKLVNEIINKITELVGSMKLELYNERTGTGLLRHVLIRWGHKTDEVMVVFVTSQKIFPSRKNMVRVLTSEFPQIKTIVQNINPRKTSIVLQDEAIVLYGNGMIHDELCGLDIAFSHNSFYQIHSEQCEVLYGLAKKMLDLKETDTVLDTYCGVGTIGLTMTDSCKKVMGVEVNPDAIENAKYNAKQNKIKNIEFVAMDSTEFMRQARKYHNHYDAIIMDPPSYGRGPKGEIWKIEDCIHDLIKLCTKILSDEPLFFLINSYTTGLAPAVLTYMLSTELKKFGGHVDSQEIGLPVSSNGLVLPCGASGRWEA